MSYDPEHAQPQWVAFWESLTIDQRNAIEHTLVLFDHDVHKICEAMGMDWDENMGWN